MPYDPRRLAPLLAALLLASFSPAGAGENPGAWTVDDMVLYREVEEPALSPDGRYAAWVESRVEKVEKEERRVEDVFLAALGGDGPIEPVRLTRGVQKISSPTFSPDGRHLAFLSDRELPPHLRKPGSKPKDDAKTQLWAIPVTGGEAFPVTRFDRSVRAFGWIDADTLAVAAPESPSAWEKEREKAGDTSEVVDDAEHEPPVRLFRVDLDGDARRLTRNDDWIDQLAVSPDGRFAVVRAQRSLSFEFDQRVVPVTRLVRLAAAEGTATAPAEELPELSRRELLPRDLRWAPDGSGFYFVAERTRHPFYLTATVSDLHFYHLGSGGVSQLELDWDPGLGGDYAATGDGVIALLHGGVRFRPVRIPRGGSPAELAGSHARNLDEWRLAHDGRTLVYRTSSTTTPPRWYAARLDGTRIAGERPLTEVDPRYRGKPTGRAEVVTWTGALGDTVEGILSYPLDWSDGDGPRPLILDVHGGPTWLDLDSWDQRYSGPNLLWRQRGAFVLQANYHGSAGYGLDWVESIEGRYYELEIPDLRTGVERLVERGLVDPERLGCSGWSNGGILCAELITRDPRFRAATVGAADVEWFSDWANVDFGAAFDNYYFGGPPWEVPEVYFEKSPFFRLTEVATPTIVHTGTEDRNVPPHQSWSLFRALQQIGRTETRLVLYPGEPHGLREIAHQRRKIEEDLAWFDEHLFGTPRESTPAIPEGSLLAGLLERAGAARDGDRYGRLVGGHLVPETVTFEGLEVGRFEVTRAQWAAHDPDFRVPPGEENLPVTGVSSEQARNYARWLADLTGRPFRLPTIAEAEKLAKAAGDDGNTLDRWAGYTPNPDDALSIAADLADLAPPAPLLLEVGSLAPAKEAGVFDLDGNAAEWATGEAGAGRPVGPSADRATDPRSPAAPDPAYVGLRVVVE